MSIIRDASWVMSAEHDLGFAWHELGTVASCQARHGPGICGPLTGTARKGQGSPFLF